MALAVVDYRNQGNLAGLPCIDGQSGALVLTRRSSGLNSHSGQWALPGGRIEKGESPVEAALREAHEEVGLGLTESQVLGCLDDYITRSGFHITPVVLWGGETGDLRPDAREVASVHRIPFSEFFREDAPLLEGGQLKGQPVLYMPVGFTCIAAPTAAIIYQFREVALCGRSTRVSHFDQPRFAWR